MQSFSESLNNPLPVRTVQRETTHKGMSILYRFDSGSAQYYAHFDIDDNPVTHKVLKISIAFQKETSGGSYITISPGDQNAFQVFATLKMLTNRVVEPYKDRDQLKIVFKADASESSRVKLYNRFADHIAKAIGGTWRSGPFNHDIAYIIERGAS